MILRDLVLPWGHRLGPSCHLFSTRPGAEGTAELRAFARSIGLRDAWIQHAGTYKEHYDLFQGRIAAADRAGAVQVDRYHAVNVWRVKRGDPRADPAAVQALEKGVPPENVTIV